MFKYIITLTIVSSMFVNINLYSKYGNHKMNSETIEKIKEYKSQNIMPQMKQWKAKIDNTISSEELEKLNVLRAKAKQFKSDMMAKHKAKKEEMSLDQRKEMRKNMKRKIKSKFKKYKKEIAKELKKISKNNEKLTSEIVEFAEKYAKKWRDDMKEIIKSTMVDDKEGVKPDKKHREKYKKRKGKEFKSKTKRFVAMVYLYDGENDEDFFQKDILDNDGSQMEAKVFPNPFNNITNIEFELKKEELVIITIYNSSGDAVGIINNQTLPAGNHSIKFEANKYNLPSGNYMFKIESQSLSLSGNMILNK